MERKALPLVFAHDAAERDDPTLRRRTDDVRQTFLAAMVDSVPMKLVWTGVSTAPVALRNSGMPTTRR